MHSNLVTTKVIKPILKKSTYITKYNGNSDSNSDDNIDFFDIDLPYNKLNIRLLANNSFIFSKKRGIFETKDETNKPSKVKAT